MAARTSSTCRPLKSPGTECLSAAKAVANATHALRSHGLRESVQHAGRIGIACADAVDDAVERQRVALDDAAAIDQEAAQLVVPSAVDDAVGPGQPAQARALG